MNVNPSTTALLVIDMQNVFLLPGAPTEAPKGFAMLPRLNQLIRAAKKAGIYTVYTRQRHDYMNDIYRQFFPTHFREDGSPILTDGSLDFELHEDLEPNPDLILDKDRYSAFYGTHLEVSLRNKGIDTVIITGVATNICCESTARDAFFRDFRVLFVEDLNATTDDSLQQATLTNIRNAFGWVVTSEELLKQVA